MMDLVKELTMNKIGNIGQKGNLGSFCQKINLGILGRIWNFGNLGRKVNVGVYRPETETLASVGQKKTSAFASRNTSVLLYWNKVLKKENCLELKRKTLVRSPKREIQRNL